MSRPAMSQARIGKVGSGAVRATVILAVFAMLTLVLMPVQAVLLRANRRWARLFPHWYHRTVCRLLGIRLAIEGRIVPDRPVLVVANHTSWLDIPVLSAVAPVSFVAKREVASWPFVGALARLQRSVFVDRTRRTRVVDTTSEIVERLGEGDAIVLFAEGTSSDGNRVLPFKSSLFAAAGAGTARLGKETAVQTIALVYTHLHGVPLGRADRAFVGWYGEMEMASHGWGLLKAGPLDVAIRIGPAMPLGDFADRKELARQSERDVRAATVALLRSGSAYRPVGAPAPGARLSIP
jgi:1-acyl-sn-glycerol-3-phosphate acyltransferase